MQSEGQASSAPEAVSNLVPATHRFLQLLFLQRFPWLYKSVLV